METILLIKKGFFDEYSANQAVELLNSEIQPLLLHLYVDRAEKSGDDVIKTIEKTIE